MSHMKFFIINFLRLEPVQLKAVNYLRPLCHFMNLHLINFYKTLPAFQRQLCFSGRSAREQRSQPLGQTRLCLITYELWQDMSSRGHKRARNCTWLQNFLLVGGVVSSDPFCGAQWWLGQEELLGHDFFVLPLNFQLPPVSPPPPPPPASPHNEAYSGWKALTSIPTHCSIPAP